MNCNEFRESLQNHMDERSVFSDAAVSHGETCESEGCRQALAEQLWLDRAVAEWRAQVPEVQLADQVLESLSEPAARVKPRGTALSAAGSTSRAWQLLAASVALVATGLVIGTPGTPPAQNVAATQADHAPQLASLEADAQVREISRRYVSWAEGTGSLVTDAVGAVLPLQPRQRANRESSAEMSPRWFDKLEPAQREINAALMFLEESVRMQDNSAT